MSHLPKVAWISILAAGAFALPLSSTASAQTAQIRHLSVVKSGGSVQIEIQTSRRVLPLTQVVTDPDRLVIDFADAVAGPELRAVNSATGEVKAVRVGRVTSNPPVTRIVVDLSSAQAFQVFPSSKSVIVKIGDGTGSVVASAPALKTREVGEKAATAPAAAPASAPERAAAAEPAAIEPAAPVPVTPAPAPAPAITTAAATPAPSTPAMTAAIASTPASALASASTPAPAPAQAAAPAPGATMTSAVAAAAPTPTMTPAVATPARAPAMTAAVATSSAPVPAPAPTTVQLASAALVPSASAPTVAMHPLSVTSSPIPSPAVTVSRLPAPAGPGAEIRHVRVLKSGGATEIEIETSQRVTPEVQVITGPDRLVLDFQQSLPGPQLRALVVNQGEVKGVRVGLLSAKPPVTRVVLDLKSPQAYQVFPSARSVIVKLPESSGATVGAAPATNAPPGPAPSVQSNRTPEPPSPPPPPKKVEIAVQDGLLSLTSNKASLAEVLNELRQQTGADIMVPAGAEREEVAVSLGPASPREVISQLLNGSRYNFIIVGADNDINKVARLILTPKSPGGVTAEIQTNPPEPVPVAQVQAPENSGGPVPPPPPTVEEPQPQADSAPPDTTPQPGDPQPPPN